MCLRLIERGFSVCATDVRPQARAALEAAGGAWATSAGALASGCEVLITVLPGPGEVSAITGEIIAALPAGATWIDMSSATPATAREIAAAAAGRDVHLLDAPVGGGPTQAREGRLLAFVGGAPDDLAAQRDVLDALADRVRHVGPQGSGYTVKLLVNLLWFGQALAGAEALSIAVRAGLDPETVRGAIQESAAASRFMERDARSLMAGDDLTSFSLAGCYEELVGVLALGEQLEVPLALAERVTDLYRQALERYGDADGELLAARLIAERAGVTFSD